MWWNVGLVLDGARDITFAKRHSVTPRGIPRLEQRIEKGVEPLCVLNFEGFISNVTVNFSVLTTRRIVGLGRRLSRLGLVTIVPCQKRDRE